MIVLLEKHNWERSYFFIIVFHMILDDIRRRNIWNIMLLTPRAFNEGNPIANTLGGWQSQNQFWRFYC
jgi:hypothetical protein